MTGSRHEPTPSDDLDPTGVRALLANLPDPGPMPDELVARISQSLELEQRRRAAAGTAPAASESSASESATAQEDTQVSATGGGSVISLAAERTRRRPGRTVMWLGGVAAVAMVATVSVNQLFGEGDNEAGVSAQYPAASDSAGDGGGEAGTDAGADAATEDESLAEAPASEEGAADEETADAGEGTAGGDQGLGAVGPLPARTIVVGLEGTIVLTSTAWADQVSALLASGPDEHELASGEGLECLSASTVRAEDAERFLLAEAQWDEETARLVVAVSPEADVAWVLTPDCQEVISGPVTLTP